MFMCTCNNFTSASSYFFFYYFLRIPRSEDVRWSHDIVRRYKVGTLRAGSHEVFSANSLFIPLHIYICMYVCLCE